MILQDDSHIKYDLCTCTLALVNYYPKDFSDSTIFCAHGVRDTIKTIKLYISHVSTINYANVAVQKEVYILSNGKNLLKWTFANYLFWVGVKLMWLLPHPILFECDEIHVYLE